MRKYWLNISFIPHNEPTVTFDRIVVASDARSAIRKVLSDRSYRWNYHINSIHQICEGAAGREKLFINLNIKGFYTSVAHAA